MRNDLHPENLPRRLRHASLRLDRPSDGGGLLVDLLRREAQHEEEMANIWAGGQFPDEVTETHLHIIWQHRRNARRLRETAAAIEREYAAGPWIALDQPFVHLDAEAH